MPSQTGQARPRSAKASEDITEAEEAERQRGALAVETCLRLHERFDYLEKTAPEPGTMPRPLLETQ